MVLLWTMDTGPSRPSAEDVAADERDSIKDVEARGRVYGAGLERYPESIGGREFADGIVEFERPSSLRWDEADLPGVAEPSED